MAVGQTLEVNMGVKEFNLYAVDYDPLAHTQVLEDCATGFYKFYFDKYLVG